MTSNASNLEAVFQPEFLNRIDKDVVRCKSLERDQLAKMVRLPVEWLRARLGATAGWRCGGPTPRPRC